MRAPNRIAVSLQVVSLLLVCCSRGTDAEGKPMQTDPLKWSLAQSPDQKKLVVELTFRNTTGGRLYVADKLVTSAGGNKLARTDRITVMNTDDPTVARFVLGVTSSDRPSTVVYEPTYEPVEAGATVHRRFEVPLPLASWHPVGGANPLSPKVKAAILIVQGFAGEPARWNTLPSDDPQPLRVPEITQDRQVWKAGPLPIPPSP